VRYFFHIGYDGSNYRGWQRLPQTNGANVQEVIEASLNKIFKTKLKIVGCGRTDAHVHASQFFFHADIEEAWDYDLKFRLNKNLTNDIAVFDIIPVDASRHARFDAIERTYNYFIHTYKDPYLTNISAYYPEVGPDVDMMIKATSLLVKYDDYSPFCKNIPAGRSAICKVRAANFYAHESGDRFRFEISANRFINGMIRIIVQKLLLIGRHRLSLDEFENYLVTRQKPSVNNLAYPQGLHLTKVRYPFLDIPLNPSPSQSPSGILSTPEYRCPSLLK
jgi:tRNA pseudouridine38-40 synthase